MNIVKIEDVNESFVALNCELGILKEIANRFTFRAENFMFNPRYKAGVWDGYIRPINQKNGLCPKGLVPKVIQYINDNGYKFILDESFNRFKETIDYKGFNYNLPFEPHDHQWEAVALFAKKKRQVILSATGCLHPDTEIEVQLDGKAFEYIKSYRDMLFTSHKITYQELYDIVHNNIGTVKVNTPTGYETVTDVYKKYSQGIHLKYTDGTETIGSVNHLMYNEQVKEFLPMSVMRKGEIIANKIIENVTNLPTQEWIDFTVNAPHESYYQNGILHHNSGKSVMIYMITRLLETQIYDNQKILIIVPSISLVTQMFNDFVDYSVNDSWDTNEKVHSIMAGVKKDSNKNIYLSTWQSLQHIKEKEYFTKFGAVIVDECHGSSAVVLSSIMEKCTSAFYRIGVSGTLSGSKIDETALIGHFGPITRVSSTKDLMNKDVLSQLKIAIVRLKYPEHICENLKHSDYTGEMDWLVRNQQRNEFICNISKTINGNTLILVQYVEKHGKILLPMLEKICTNKKVFFVYGGTEAIDRENVRKIAESHNDIIILASYQVFSTGVNIKNLPNIILASSTKSVIRLLQSIGRGLRKHVDKEICTIIDITDDLRGKRKKANYTLKHCMERIEIYQKEEFKVVEKVIDLSNKF